MAVRDTNLDGKPKPAHRRAVVLLGPPGAGKGTQAKLLAGRLGILHVSSGDMLREQVAQASELGFRVRPIVEAGDLVPDELVNKMMAERLAQQDCAPGFVLDGFPRTVGQARALNQFLGGRRGPVVINLQVEYNRLIQRLTGRRCCPQCGRIYNVFLKPPGREGFCDCDGAALIHRPDDYENVIRERLAAYESLTRPLVKFYRRRSSFYEVDGNEPPESVTNALCRILENRRP